MAINNSELWFTEKGTVIYSTPKGVIEKTGSRFFKELERNYKKDSHNVIFDEENNKFTITIDGFDYDVVLPEESQRSLIPSNSGPTYSPLVLKLLYLSMIEQQYNDYTRALEVRNAKIKEMDDSFYENMKTLEDHEIYAEYLEAKYKKAKTKEERDLINTKLANLYEYIKVLRQKEKQENENPLNLKLHINRFIYDLLDKAKLLDDSKRIKVANLLRKIVLEYQRIVKEYNRSGNSLKLGNPLISLEILGKIVDVEFLVAKYLSEKKTNDYIDSRMGNVIESLEQNIIPDEKGSNVK